jgi:hypothetical protein
MLGRNHRRSYSDTGNVAKHTVGFAAFSESLSEVTGVYGGNDFLLSSRDDAAVYATPAKQKRVDDNRKMRLNYSNNFRELNGVRLCSTNLSQNAAVLIGNFVKTNIKYDVAEFIKLVLDNGSRRLIFAVECHQVHEIRDRMRNIADQLVETRPGDYAPRLKHGSGFASLYNIRTYVQKPETLQSKWLDWISVQKGDIVLHPRACTLYNMKMMLYSPTLFFYLGTYYELKYGERPGFLPIDSKWGLKRLLKVLYAEYLQDVFYGINKNGQLFDNYTMKSNIATVRDNFKVDSAHDTSLYKKLYNGVSSMFSLTVTLYSQVENGEDSNKTLISGVNEEFSNMATFFGNILDMMNEEVASKNAMVDWIRYFKVTQTMSNRSSSNKRQRVRQENAVNDPIVVKSSDIWAVTRKLITLALGDDRECDKTVCKCLKRDSWWKKSRSGELLERLIGDVRSGGQIPEAFTALTLLLQICYGSRAVGVVAQNRLGLDVDKVFAAQTGSPASCILVANVSKEKDRGQKALKVFNTRPGVVGETSRASVQALDTIMEEQSAKTITRPVQSFFLDPSRYCELPGTVIDAEIPMATFFNLFRVMREAVKIITEQKFEATTFAWLKSTPVDHWYLDDRSRHDKDVIASVAKLFNPLQNNLLRKVANSVSPNLFESTKVNKTKGDVGTHTCRKIYVNYSFAVYGSKYKEIGWAHKVLQHMDFSTSMNYLTMKITGIDA